MPLLKFIDKFKAYSCKAVILGCTELPLATANEISPLPHIDSTGLLAQKALLFAMEKK